jgi:hypothetical protein
MLKPVLTTRSDGGHPPAFPQFNKRDRHASKNILLTGKKFAPQFRPSHARDLQPMPTTGTLVSRFPNSALPIRFRDFGTLLLMECRT